MSRGSQVVEPDIEPAGDAPGAAADGAAADAAAAARPRRADAERNRRKLIDAARAAFADSGDASLEGIARRAGVGIGTLYRNFADRRELLEAVYVDEVEQLCNSAADFDGDEPWDALAGWLNRFVSYVTTKHALLDEMVATLGPEPDKAVFLRCHEAISAAGKPLVERAQQAGQMRSDVEFVDVIRLVGGIAGIKNADPGQVRHLLEVALDGLRYRG